MTWNAIQRKAKAIFPFGATGPSQLGLNVGDEVLLHHESPDWYKGTLLATRQSGIFPKSYVELMEGEVDDAEKERLTSGGPKDAKAEAKTEDKASEKAGDSEESTAKGDESKPADGNGSETGKEGVTDTPATKTPPPRKTTVPGLPANAVVPKSAAGLDLTPKPPPGTEPGRVSHPTPSPEKKPEKKPDTPVPAAVSPEPAAVISPRAATNIAPEYSEIASEISQVLRAWGVAMKRFHDENHEPEVDAIRGTMARLVEARRLLLSPATNEEDRVELKSEISEIIAAGNDRLGLDVVPRLPNGKYADEHNSSIIDLYRLHVRCTQRSLDVDANAQQPPVPPAGSSSRRGKSQLLLNDRRGSGIMPPGNFQILLDIKATIFMVGEPTELRVSIYSQDKNAFITEEYVVQLTGSGTPLNMDDIGNLKTLFKDLSPVDFNSHLHLVFKIIRIGRMSADEKDAKKEKTPSTFRRPFGCAVFPVTAEAVVDNLIRRTEYSPDGNLVIYQATSDAQFPSLHEHIITKQNVRPVTKAKGIAIGLRVYHGDLPELSKRHPEVDTVSKASVINKFGFPEIVLPEDQRNDLYVTVECGEFLQGSKKTAKNIEFTCRVILNNGMTVQNSFRTGEGPGHRVSEYRSIVYYHLNNPRWMEVLCLDLSPSDMEKASLLITFSHCSTKKKNEPFSFCVLPLVDDAGILRKDDVYHPPVYKFSESNVEKQVAAYLDASDPKTSGKVKLTPRKEDVTISTLLCSTRVTQNSLLHALLKWQSHEEKMDEVLKKFTYVEQFEVVKFVREIFDSLFEILHKYREQTKEGGEDVATLVYNALIFIIGILVDAKFNNFRPILDSYIENHFTQRHAYDPLLHCLRTYLSKPDSPQVASHIRASMKALRYTIRLIIKSRQSYIKGEVVEDDGSFKATLSDVLTIIYDLMTRTSPEWVIGAQIITLKNFGSVLEDLSQVYDNLEIAEIIVSFLNSVQASSKRQLNIEKLALIRFIANSQVFADVKARECMLSVMVTQLVAHISRSQEETTACMSTISDILSLVVPKDKTDPTPSGTDLWALFPLVTHLAKLVQSTMVGSSASVGTDVAKVVTDVDQLGLDGQVAPETVYTPEAVACLLTLLFHIQQPIIERYCDEVLKTKASQAAFLSTLIKVSSQVVTDEPFSSQWGGMNIVAVKNASTVLTIASAILKERFSGAAEGTSFSVPLFSDILNALFDILHHPSLQLETLTEAKVELITRRSGDMRPTLRQLLLTVWEWLDDRQSHFVPDLVPPSLDLMVSRSDEMKSFAVDFFFSVMVREFAETGKFDKVERRTIDTLDQSPVLSSAAMEFRETFTTALTAKLEEREDLRVQGQTFLKDIEQLLDLMSALQRYPNDPEYEDERTSAALQLMAYLQQTDRKDMYITYVNYLCNLHLSLGNYIEAGVTVLLHAAQLEWSEVDSTSMSPKERLLSTAIEYFDKGKDWERAIRLCRDLVHQYEFEQFEYKKLAKTLRNEAELFNKIISSERFYAEYFRVGFWGKGFTADYSNKEFIYRGFELERVGDFANRLMRKFPMANLLKTATRPGEEVTGSEDQILQISTVQPSSPQEREGLQREFPEKMPARVSKYLSLNNINIFLHSRSFRKEKKGDNEHKTVWVANQFLETADCFPGLQRRSEIVDVREIILSPVETAVNVIETKNGQLQSILAAHEKSGPGRNINEFTMVLNGVIDAGVNGGALKYRDAFFTPDFLKENPDKKEHVDRLRNALQTQLDCCERGLTLHRKLCAADMIGLQDHLEGAFQKMKRDLADALVPKSPAAS